MHRWSLTTEASVRTPKSALRRSVHQLANVALQIDDPLRLCSGHAGRCLVDLGLLDAVDSDSGLIAS
jgi:hypothetical protein